MPVLPSSYDSLDRWFPTATARARALGVSREIVRRWDASVASGFRPEVRERTVRVVERVAALASEAERLTGDAQAAGRWILTAQPALRGKTVAWAAGEGRLRDIQRLLEPTSRQPAEPREFTLQGVRAGAASIPAERGLRYPRERPRDADKAAALRRIGMDEALIGPSR
jgi:hypothetical protein